MNPHSDERFVSKVVKKLTPEGTMFVIIDEESNTGKPVAIRINIGKAGTGLMAWAFSLSALATLAIQKGATIEDIITLLSNANSDRTVTDVTTPIKSGPAGFVQALIVYNHEKYKQLEELLATQYPKRARLWGRSRRT